MIIFNGEFYYGELESRKTNMTLKILSREDYEQVSDEINEIKETCGEETTLKVILETGALQTATNIQTRSKRWYANYR